ncbi:MAG: serine/threonine protein kinase [Polyangiaceae bacterium]|nr:serine/threonine protein kinase [Polyangiaceae bacterium]
MPGTIRPPDGDVAEWTGLSTPKPAASGQRPAEPNLRAPAVPTNLDPPSRVSVSNPVVSRPTQASRPEGPLTKVCPECGRRFPGEFRVCPHDAKDLLDEPEEGEAERDELIGAVLNETYSIIRTIGEGGMGRVYEARHTRLSSKRFAIKVMHPEYTRQPEVVSRFQREAEAASSLRSPHVVGVYDVGRTPDGRPFMVAEYLEGKELADFLTEQGKLSVPMGVRIVRQICKALTLAHEKGVIHRDMKPENVFLTGDLRAPTATVLDFGISKIGDGSGTNLTKTGMIMGTPSYMAPEQARGERVDHRADVYAVGAILYAALTGQRPFDHNDPMVTVTAVLTRDPAPPRSIEPTIPEALELAIQRAMAKEPAQRYQSMAELDADLAVWDPEEHGTGAESRPTATPVRLAMTQAVEQKAHAIRIAWPMVVTLTALGAAWLFGTMVTTLAALIRIFRGGTTADLSGTEALLLSALGFFVLATPLGLVARHLWKNVRNNRVREVELAERMRGPVIVGLSAYGFATLLVRNLEVVLIRSAASWGWPIWDLILFVVAFAGAAGAHFLNESKKRV